MQKVIILSGLPASGKTQWANEQIKQFPNRYKNICKDNLRKMFDNSFWSHKNEDFIVKVRNSLILMSVESGFDVIISDTNLNPDHEIQIRLLVEGKAEVEIKFLDVDVNECIRRDVLRQNPVGEKVIMDMYLKYLYKFPHNMQKEKGLM
jgi:predicted kinase